MGNIESASNGVADVPILDEDDSSLPPSPVGTEMDTSSSSRSFTTLSSSSEEEEDIYNDYPEEETLVCGTSLFSRKSNPLLLQQSPSGSSSTLPLKRSSSSMCFSSSNNNNKCSPPSMPRASSWTSFSLDDFGSSTHGGYTLEELEMPNGDLPTDASDLRPSLAKGCRKFWIVTTAALPWMTGTAVNPLLRAAHFSRMNRTFANGKSTVTLVIPWLESPEERVKVYGSEWQDKTQQDQDEYIRNWLSKRAGLPLEANLEQGGIRIHFYPARLHSGMNSIFPMGNICGNIPAEEADICFLEEPEHLNWYKPAEDDYWSQKFHHVVGIGHTNYKAYVAEHAFFYPPIVGTISSLMVRAYCHKLVKLSSVLQTYAPEKEVTMNVHGIRSEFLEQQTCTTRKGIYFIGKLLWAKGFDKLLDLQAQYRKEIGEYFEMDIIGSGPEQDEIQRAFQGRSVLQREKDKTSASGDSSSFPKSRYEFRKDAIPANFCGRKDHAECTSYKVFVNPSITEVLCTTTAEAIAMGKFVLVPVHPSNEFFYKFPNCLQYSSRKEFVALLRFALTHDPEPLSAELQHELTWEAATERCLEAAAISRRDAARRERIGKTKSDHLIAKLHNSLGRGYKGDVIRKVLGGGPVSAQVEYEQEKQTMLSSISSSVVHSELTTC